MNEERKPIAKIVDIETGEVLDDIFEGDSIRRAQDNNKEKVVKNYNNNKEFVKLFEGTEELHEIIKNEAAFNTAIRLSKFISYTDCVLRSNGHRNGKILNVHDLAEEMKIPYNTLRRHISILYKNGILAFCKTGTKGNPGLIKDCIIANPDVFMRGANVNESVLSVFEDAGWRGYQNNSAKNT